MATIPLQLAQRRLDTGSVVQYPQGSPIGGAMQGLGDELQQAAALVQQKQAQKDQFDGKIREAEFDADLSSLEDEAVRGAPADGNGLHDSVYGQIDPVTQRAVKPGSFDGLFDIYRDRMPESQRADFEARREFYRKQGSQRLATVQYDAEQKYYDVEIARQQNRTLNSIAATNPQDAKAIEKLKQDGLDFINSSGKPALYKDAARADWLAKSEEAQFQGRLTRDPSFAATAQAALGLAPRAGVAAKDIPTEGAALLETIAGPESGGQYDVRYTPDGGSKFSDLSRHPNIAEPTRDGRQSTAAGKYQFVKATWDRAARALGLKDFSPESQDKAAWWLARQDYQSHTGRDLLSDLKSPDANVQAGIRRTLSQTWEGLKGMGDGDFANRIAAGPAPAAGQASTQYANIPLERRIELHGEADAQAVQNTARYESGAQDYVAYLRAGNTPQLGGDHSPDRIGASLPPERAAMLKQQITDAASSWRRCQGPWTARSGRVQQILGARQKLMETPENHRQEAQDIDGLRAAVADRDDAIKADPATYVMRQPAIASAYQATAGSQDPAAAQAYASATLAEQTRLGVPKAAQRVLPAAQAADYVARFNDRRAEQCRARPDGGAGPCRLARRRNRPCGGGRKRRGAGGRRDEQAEPEESARGAGIRRADRHGGPRKAGLVREAARAARPLAHLCRGARQHAGQQRRKRHAHAAGIPGGALSAVAEICPQRSAEGRRPSRLCRPHRARLYHQGHLPYPDRTGRKGDFQQCRTADQPVRCKGRDAAALAL